MTGSRDSSCFTTEGGARRHSGAAGRREELDANRSTGLDFVRMVRHAECTVFDEASETVGPADETSDAAVHEPCGALTGSAIPKRLPWREGVPAPARGGVHDASSVQPSCLHRWAATRMTGTRNLPRIATVSRLAVSGETTVFVVRTRPTMRRRPLATRSADACRTSAPSTRRSRPPRSRSRVAMM